MLLRTKANVNRQQITKKKLFLINFYFIVSKKYKITYIKFHSYIFIKKKINHEKIKLIQFLFQ